jgi:peroxiredoxin
MIEITAGMESIVQQAILSFVATILVSVLQRPACRFFKFVEEGVRVVSVSVDDREKSEALVDKHQLGFPVAYGADARAVSEITGAFVNDNPVSLQAIGFVLNPEGRIVTAVYSTRAIGRLMSDDVVNFIRHLRSSAKN